MYSHKLFEMGRGVKCQLIRRGLSFPIRCCLVFEHRSTLLQNMELICQPSKYSSCCPPAYIQLYKFFFGICQNVFFHHVIIIHCETFSMDHPVYYPARALFLMKFAALASSYFHFVSLELVGPKNSIKRFLNHLSMGIKTTNIFLITWKILFLTQFVKQLITINFLIDFELGDYT